MKTKSILLLLLCLLLVGSCKKNDNPVDAQTSAFKSSDVMGVWKGEAKNSSNTVPLNLTVGDSCKVSGSGVNCTWSVDPAGKVTGEGSFMFTSGGSLIWAWSSWTLQMSADKKTMTGTFNVTISSLNNMQATLTKQ
ncbi:MAG: hypothetical protein NTZ35_08330 [Ignavibacteriales bacterium]|nr:hypothetical protein [Ignavibacteriales bacterium]